jgi:hypothetical protein
MKKPFEALEHTIPQPKGTRGRGGKREIPRRIEEFYPRGAAGRHEARGPKGPNKAAMPHKGNRPRNPK